MGGAGVVAPGKAWVCHLLMQVDVALPSWKCVFSCLKN